MPLADFACLSKKCARKDGTAPVFEATTKAIACPACGSRKIKRLFNRVNIRTGRSRFEDGDMRHTSSSKAARIDQLARPAMDAADRKLSEYRAMLLSKFPAPRAVPTRNLAAGIQKALSDSARAAGTDVDPGQIPVSVDQRDLSRKAEISDGSLGALDSRQGAAIPTIMNARDPEYRVARTADGTPTIEKAG